MTKEAIKERGLIIFFVGVFSALAHFITASHVWWLRMLFFALAVVFGIGTYFIYVLINSTMEIKKDEKEKKRQEAENERSKKIMEKLREKEKQSKI